MTHCCPMRNPLVVPAVLAACCTLAACTTTPRPATGHTATEHKASEHTDGIARARLGEKVYVDGPHITPLAVLEDSRCPAKVQCVWAGRVKLSVRIHLGSRDEDREVILGQPVHVADGSLELVEVTPARTTEAAIPPGNYRFGFRFMGGL